MSTSSATPDWSFELEAMKAIAAALDGLPDAESRARVLGWAVERFAADGCGPLVRRGDPSSTGMPREDPQLAIPSADELYGVVDRDVVHCAIVASPRAPQREPGELHTLVREFVDDFQQFACDWQRELTACKATRSAPPPPPSAHAARY